MIKMLVTVPNLLSAACAYMVSMPLGHHSIMNFAVAQFLTELRPVFCGYQILKLQGDC